MLERLHNWTIRFAYTKQASLMLFLVSFSESSFFPIPPDPLMMIMTALRPRRWVWYAFVTTVASVLGALAAYVIGFYFYETIGVAIIDAYHLEDAAREVAARYQEHAFLTVLGAAFTPLPFKVFTLSAGLFKIDLFALVAASVLGRGIRFFTVSALMYAFGSRAEIFIKKYFGILAFAFFVLLVVGFVLVIRLF